MFCQSVNRNPSECGMLQATLLLAEDRVLSFGVVLKGKTPCYTTYVPDAVFYFEVCENAVAAFLFFLYFILFVIGRNQRN